MSQYSSRIYIHVEKNDDFIKLNNLDFKNVGGVPSGELFDEDKNEAIFEDISFDETDLRKFVELLAKKAKNVVIIADTININENPCKFGVYYLGKEVKTFFIEESEKEFKSFNETKIDNVAGWLASSGCAVSPADKRHLKSHGIEYIKKSTKTQKKQTFTVRFYFEGRGIVSAMSTIPWVSQKRTLLDMLEDQGPMFSANIGYDFAEFEVPKLEKEEIENYLLVLAKSFYPVYALAFNSMMNNFVFVYPKYGKVFSEEVACEKLGLNPDVQLNKDVCIEEIVDMRKLPDYF